jgi:pantetheine-phosphate adenylyltransferase
MVGNFVLIGLCTDKFAKKISKNHNISTYKERFIELEVFLKNQKVKTRYKIVPLEDPYGLTITEKKIEAIVVSQETEPVAHIINMIRKRKNYIPLKIIVVKMIPAKNHVSISTTRIRNGEIDKEGNLIT